MLRLTSPLLVSLLLHVGLGLAFVVPGRAEPQPAPDRWVASGEGVEVVELGDVMGGATPASPAALAGGPESTPEVAPAEPSPAVPEPSSPEPVSAPAGVTPSPVGEASPAAATAARPAPTAAPAPSRPEPRRRPRRSRRPRPASEGNTARPTEGRPAPAATGGAPGAAGPAGSAAAPGGTPGVPGLPPGVRPLDGAFARALAYTAAGVQGWNALDAGTTQTAEVEFVVGDDGTLAEIVARGPVAELRAAAERTRHLLQSGRFALRADAVERGRRVYRLTLRFSHAEATDETWSDANHATGIGFEAPTEARPGKAEFTLRSGRRVTITVARVR